MSLVSLDNIAMILSDLNRELAYKSSENNPGNEEKKFLTLISDGDNHSIWLTGMEIWNSRTEKELENIPLEKEIILNEREHFEAHIRCLIMDAVNVLNKIEM
jgi:hypothetical protein